MDEKDVIVAQLRAVMEHELKDVDGLRPLNGWRVVQQIELLDRPFASC